MSNLVDFFWNKIYSTIDQNNRYNTVLQFNDVILVNFDCLYERECALRGVDQLLFYLHTIGQGKRFIFISEDGAILNLSSAINVITNIITTFNLNPETCAVICREQLDIPNAAVYCYDSIPYWCKVLILKIQNIPIPTGKFNKKFAVWFNRGTLFRLLLTKHLYDNHKQNSLISYQESGIVIDRKMTEYYQDLLSWAQENTPIVYDQLFTDKQYTIEMIVGTRHPYEEYFMEIICETDILGTSWITEKTIKNLYVGKPFVVMSGPRTLAKLHQYGFKTFSPWIDESYDLLENHHERLQAIIAEIDRIALLDVNELHKNIKPILEHNRLNYLKILKDSSNENSFSR